MDKEATVEQQRSELEGLDRAYSESKEEVVKCEDMIHQLTGELDATQRELSNTQSRLRDSEDTGKELREKVQEAKHEVRNGCYCIPNKPLSLFSLTAVMYEMYVKKYHLKEIYYKVIVLAFNCKNV